MSEQKGVLLAAALVLLGGGVGGAPEVLAAAGGGGGSLPGPRRGLVPPRRGLAPPSWEEEGAVAGVLVQVVLRLLLLSVLGGQRRTSGHLGQFVFQLLQLLGQLFQGVGVVGRDGVGESLETDESS